MSSSKGHSDKVAELSARCCDEILEEIAKEPAYPATDEEIRHWSQRASTLARAMCRAADLDEAAISQAARAVALEIVAYLVAHQPGRDAGGSDASTMDQEGSDG